MPDSAESPAGGGSSRTHVTGSGHVSPWIGQSCAESAQISALRGRVLWGSWRQPEHWAILYCDHGSDFTSRHIEAVCADLHIALVHSTAGVPQACPAG